MPRASFSPSFYFHAEGHHMKSCNWVSRGSRNRSKGLCRKVTCCPSWEEKPARLFRYQPMAELPAAQVSSSLYITCCTQHIFNVRERSLENSCASALPQSPFPSGSGEEWHASRFTTGTRLLSCLSTFNLAQHVALLLLNKDLKSLISLHLRTAPLADGDGSRQQARGWRLHPACVAASWLCQTPQHSCSLETVLLTWNPPEKTKPDVPGSKDRIFFFAQQFPPLTGDARLGLAEERRGWPEPLARFSPFSSEPWRPDQMLGAIPAPSVREFWVVQHKFYFNVW